MNAIPRADENLPSLFKFTRGLSDDVDNGKVIDRKTADEKIRRFFTRGKLASVDAVIPGWWKMAGYADGATLLHVTTVLAALPLLPEFLEASPDRRALSEWIVLFHDVQKEPVNGQRDYRHAFRSAAKAGLALPALGFDVPGSRTEIQGWAQMTDKAVTIDPHTGRYVQDHSRLPSIVAGIDRIFGLDTPAALVVKGVLFHMSISVLPAWPQPVELTDDEIRRYITPPLLPLLRIMMLADNDSYAFFDPSRKARDRDDTRAALDRVNWLVGVMVP